VNCEGNKGFRPVKKQKPPISRRRSAAQKGYYVGTTRTELMLENSVVTRLATEGYSLKYKANL